MSGTKSPDKSWNITMTLSDRYDFDEWRRRGGFGSFANNMGFIMQRTYILRPYEWDATYSFKYYEK